jgi:hypothetical protein
MNSIDIVIPTKSRREKLIRCITSIFSSNIKDYKFNVYIYSSNMDEFFYYYNLFTNYKNIVVLPLVDYTCSKCWNNHLANMISDCLMTCNDDVIFEYNTIKNIFIEYNKYFPDNDGVMGINQENIPDHLDSAFTIIGKKYSERFPDKKMWSEDYYRFYADREMGDYAKSIGKFQYSKECKIYHDHPSFNKEAIDDTHKDVRTYLEKDKLTYYNRKNKI